MKAQIDSLFPNNNCIHSTNSSKIRLKEVDKITQIIYNEDEKEHFIISNNNKTEINILIVDGCLEFKPEQRKCDFAFWNTNNFYFVEIKAIKIKNRKKYKKDIIEQLEETIKYFTNKNKRAAAK